ncbi:hypothetical protein E4T44_02300 [Aureobasidium sp. EXF-8845]|nr:hypothetical protein E4T45_05958 [Aureobasidium sp. EXF-8846]KAI4851166.1 hypothetical protein E4T44_02300 [Aureobasidium sp. EXF-8845]
MSVEDLGMRELGQVRSQRLDEFLTTLRLLQNPSANSRIGIPALDKLLANHTTRFDPTNLSAIPAPPIIELTSPGPKSGKTELLYWIIAKLVLGSDTHDNVGDVELQQADETARGDATTTPDDTKDNRMTDPRAQAVEQDTNIETEIPHRPPPGQPDHHNHPPPTDARGEPDNHHTKPTTIAFISTSPVDIPRLTQLLLQTLLSSSPHLPLSTAQDLIHKALSHIHIFQPSSLSSLIATISSLPTYFLNPKNGSVEKRLGAIIIDSASTFFWHDKVGAVTGQGQGQGQSKYPALASTLKRTSITLQTPIIFTTENISATTPTITSTSASSATSADTTAIRSPLPSPFSTLPTLRLIISRDAIQPFSKDMDAETAIKHAEAREKAVREAEFVVSVNKWGNDGQRGRQGSGDVVGLKVVIDGKGVTVL